MTPPRPPAGLVVMLLLVALVPAVSAFEPIEKSIDIYNYGESHFADLPQNQGSASGRTFNQLLFPNIEYCNQLRLIQFEHSGGYWSVPDQSQNTHVTYTIGSTVIGYGEAGTFKAGANKVIWFTFDSWDISGYTGNQIVTVTPDSPTTFPSTNAFTFYRIGETNYNWDDNAHRVYLKTGATDGILTAHCSLYYTEEFRNRFTINNVNGIYEFSLYRNIGGKAYGSNLYLKSGDTIYSTGSINSLLDEEYKLLSDNIQVGIRPVGASQWHNFTYGESGPGDEPIPDNRAVSVYAQNAQTGALIANTDLAINEYGTENWYNSTLEWGWTAVDLPAGNYEFYAFADGFTQFAPGRLTVDDNGDSLTLLLYPDELPPSAGNVTLQIWANEGNRGDGRYYGISNAEISINGNAGEGAGYSSGILTTNEQGYLNVEVPGNTSYVVYASKLGYIPGESRITVSTYSPVKVSVTLTTGAIPTAPPLTPTIQPTTPKPTQTTPPGSFIDTSAGGLANLFGTTLETGKTLLGFLVALAVGMGAAKQLRGGAPEFVVGFLGASFLGLVAGLIPVGFFVLIALLCGVYLGKTYIGGGDNGR